MKQYILKLFQAPGDVVVFSNLVRDIKVSHPDWKIDVLSFYPEVMHNNPHLTHLPKESNIPILNFTHELLLANRRPHEHISTGFYNVFNFLTNENIKQLHLFPEIYLTEKETSKDILNKLDISGEYFLFNAGFKNDMPLKQWSMSYWQELLNECKKRNIQLIQIGSNTDIHPEFKNVTSIVGKTENLRDLFSVCYHSQGIISGVSLPIHIAAAFKKFCVVIGGGRENPRFEQYPNQQYLHTVGQLDCCKYSGCWKSQRNECLKMMTSPACMLLINPEDVLRQIVRYIDACSLERRWVE